MSDREYFTSGEIESVRSGEQVQAGRSRGKFSVVVCQAPAATHVDTLVFHSSFVPFRFPRSGGNPDKTVQEDATPFVPYERFFGGALRAAREREMRDVLKVPSYEEFEQKTKLRLAVDTAHEPDVLRRALEETIDKERLLRAHYDSLVAKAYRVLLAKKSDDGLTLLFAKDPADALERLQLQFCQQHKLFTDGYLSKKIDTSPSPLSQVLDDLGILFLERTRIRPIGHTLERAPFYEVALAPGEVVTLRQKSFSKRATTLEQLTEQTEESKLEFSSMFTTEFAEEYGHSVEETTNWGISQSITGGFGNGIWNLSGTTEGNYDATTTETTSRNEVARRAEEIARKVETAQKISHRTAVTISKEEAFEEEAIRVIRNDDVRLKKLYLRRLMQVLHVSYERYGLRLCWAPTIEDPGRDVRRVVPGPEGFAAEIEAIEARYREAMPPPEVGVPPKYITTTYGWRQESGWSGPFPTGKSFDEPRSVPIPGGYEYVSVRAVKTGRQGNVYAMTGGRKCEHNKTYPEPSIGSTGEVTIWVHVGVRASETAEWTLELTLRPAGQSVEAWDAVVTAWRQQQIANDTEKLLAAKREEYEGVDPQAWPPSELMRRVLAEYFDVGEGPASWRLAHALHTVFEWENINATLYPPWWKRTEINGLHAHKTDFLNASFAKVYIPIRRGFETQAIAYLLAIGALSAMPQWLPYIEEYVRGMRNQLEPLFTRTYRATEGDAKDIDGAPDIGLTVLGSADWAEEFERESGFTVLNRLTITIPTDGVDIEEQPALCPVETPSLTAQERRETAAAAAAAAIAKRLDSGEGEIRAEVQH